jgi:hypothetical protein
MSGKVHSADALSLEIGFNIDVLPIPFVLPATEVGHVPVVGEEEEVLKHDPVIVWVGWIDGEEMDIEWRVPRVLSAVYSRDIIRVRLQVGLVRVIVQEVLIRWAGDVNLLPSHLQVAPREVPIHARGEVVFYVEVGITKLDVGLILLGDLLPRGQISRERHLFSWAHAVSWGHYKRIFAP